MKKDENSSKKHPSPLRSQAQILYSPASGKTFISHAASSYLVKAVPSQNSTSEVFAKNCDITKTTKPLVAGKENEGQMKSNRQPRHNIQELREYMHHQAVERRRKVLQMRKEAQREDERKQRNMHEVIKKQRQVLHRAKREQQQEYTVCKWMLSGKSKKQMFLPRHLKDYHLHAVAIMRSKCALTQNRGSSEEKKRCARVADTTEEQLSVFPRQNQSVSVWVHCRAHSTFSQPQEGSIELASISITEIDTTWPNVQYSMWTWNTTLCLLSNSVKNYSIISELNCTEFLGSKQYVELQFK